MGAHLQRSHSKQVTVAKEGGEAWGGGGNACGGGGKVCWGGGKVC